MNDQEDNTMPFKRNPQKFSAAVTPVTIGTGERAVTLGGENVMPLYTFDAPIENRPRIGVEIAEPGFEKAMYWLIRESFFIVSLSFVFGTAQKK